MLDWSASRTYKAGYCTSQKVDVSLYDSNSSEYFDIWIDISKGSITKQTETEHVKVHIEKDGKYKGGVYFRRYKWPNYCCPKYFPIDVDSFKETIYDIYHREYGIDHDLLDFVCDLIKIIHDYCLDNHKRNNRKE